MMNQKNNEIHAVSVTVYQKIARVFFQHPLLIFFVPFMIYMSNGREISSGDPTPTFFTAVQLVKHGTIFLDDLHDYIPYNNLPYYVSEQQGHIVSNYPVFPAVMAAPVMAPFVWMGMVEKGDGDLVWKYLTKLSGALFTALAVWMMFLTLCLIIERESALLLSFIYGLGTALFPIASQSLWQHGPSVFWWGVCLYFLFSAFLLQQTNLSQQTNHTSTRWFDSLAALLFWGGTAAGCAVLCRTVNGVSLAILSIAAIVHFRFRVLFFIVPAAFLALLLLGYNFTIFGSWKGGDVVLHSLQWELDRISTGAWATPLHIGFAGQLISPSRGILIFSPFLLFAFWGMIQSTRSKEPLESLFVWLIPVPVLLLILFSKYSVWWGGNSHFGPRYQIETYPFLMIYLAIAWKSLSTSVWLKRIFLVLVLYSVWVQLVGVFCYPGGWSTEPVSLSEDYGRLWNWTYNQIWTCAQQEVKLPFQ